MQNDENQEKSLIPSALIVSHTATRHSSTQLRSSYNLLCATTMGGGERDYVGLAL